MRVRRLATLLTAVAVLIAMTAVPVQADSPVETEEPIFFIFPDFENGLVVFWNTTRADFCQWLEDGALGPPPVIELVSASFHETAQGALVASFQAERHIELWSFDADVPPLGDNPCTDTNDQAGPWAEGVVRVTASDNDLFNVSDTRINSFGDRGTGTVHNEEGAWHYSWTFRAHCDVDCMLDFNLKVDNPNLKKKRK